MRREKEAGMNCPYCQLDTAGNHHVDCPLSRKSSGLPPTGTYLETTSSCPNCARLKALLADDKFAKKIAKECNDRDHDDRWCPTCEGRDNGIADYRDAIKTRIKEEGVG